MVELIVSIFAGLGFCSLVHFVIHLIEKMGKNSKMDKKVNIPQGKELYYWYIAYICRQCTGSAFISTDTENFRLEDIKVSLIEDDPRVNGPIIITNFTKVSKKFFDKNKEESVTLNL